MFYFFFAVLRLHCRHCKKITNLVSPLHAVFFLREIKTGDPIRVRWAHLARLGGQSDYRNRLILLTGAFSCIMREIYHIWIGLAHHRLIDWWDHEVYRTKTGRKMVCKQESRWKWSAHWNAKSTKINLDLSHHIEICHHVNVRTRKKKENRSFLGSITVTLARLENISSLSLHHSIPTHKVTFRMVVKSPENQVATTICYVWSWKFRPRILLLR